MMKKILIVEGVEDQLFFQQFLRNQKLNDVDVKCTPSGKGNAINTFESLLKLNSHHRIGLVVDADLPMFGGGYSSTVTTINNNLSNVKFSPLSHISGGGLKSSSKVSPDKKVGVWVMPDNSLDGYIENFLEPIILSNYVKSYSHASSVSAVAIDVADVGFTAKPNHRVKSNMGAWLAWHDPPWMSFAKALSQNYFDVNATSYKSIANWIDWLFK